jgi:hypothetical protein
MPEPPDLIWQQLHWPTPFDSDRALGLLRRLASDRLRQPVIFEARSHEGEVHHFVGTAAHQVRDMSQLLEAHVPGAIVGQLADERGSFTRLARVKLSRPLLSLRIDHVAQASRSILGALAAAHYHGERAVLQVVVGRGLSPSLTSPELADPTQSWLNFLVHGIQPASHEATASVRDKNRDLAFKAIIRVSASAQSEGRQTEIIRGLLAALRTVQGPGSQIDFTRDHGPLDKLPRSGWLRLASSEAVSLMGWPLDADDLPGMPEPHPKLLRLRSRSIETQRIFATTNAPGETSPLGVSVEDALFHTIVLGPTGAGKSTSLLNLIVADLKGGRSVVVIDPKKDLVGDVLEHIPTSRARDVVVLDPSQSNPVGLNPLIVPGASPELIADGILAIFRDLFPSAFGPRTSDLMHASLLTLAHHPNATLVWLPRLLIDARFRRSLTQDLDDPDGLDSFWDRYDDLSEREQAQHIGPVLSRLRQFLLRPSLRRVLDQSQPRFALGDLFTKPRVLLVPINAGLLGRDASRLLGSLLVSQLWQLTLARAEQPKDQRPPVSIYIDEAQEFLRLGSDLSDALALSRSLGVAWHLAHQYRHQMPRETLSAIDANARNKIVFTLGIEDAKAMAAMTTNLSAEDFMSLPRHAVYASLMRRGRQLGWVSGQTLPPPPAISNPADIAALSQARYGRSPGTDATASARSEPASPKESMPKLGRKRRTE